MRKFRSKVQFAVTGPFCVILALMLLVLPLRWILAAILAAAFHEFCHWSAVQLCGGRLQTFYVGRSGAVMRVTALTRGKELVCALAGPLGGLLLLPLARWLPRTAICAAFQSVYNLLPIYPLDGGRALRCAAELLFPRCCGKICKSVSFCALIGICALALYGTFILGLGLVPLLMAAALVFRWKKYLAKNP